MKPQLNNGTQSQQNTYAIVYAVMYYEATAKQRAQTQQNTYAILYAVMYYEAQLNNGTQTQQNTYAIVYVVMYYEATAKQRDSVTAEHLCNSERSYVVIRTKVNFS